MAVTLDQLSLRMERIELLLSQLVSSSSQVDKKPSDVMGDSEFMALLQRDDLEAALTEREKSFARSGRKSSRLRRAA
jgi:hypothetical protein